MKLKENIKSKVDQLDPSELRIVGVLIDTLKERRKTEIKERSSDNPPHLKIIALMGSDFLTSDDIFVERQERI